jgi:hypothetical protein
VLTNTIAVFLQGISTGSIWGGTITPQYPSRDTILGTYGWDFNVGEIVQMQYTRESVTTNAVTVVTVLNYLAL